MALRPALTAVLVTLAVTIAVSTPVRAQGPLPDAPTSPVEPAASTVSTPVHSQIRERFWDRTNVTLFAANAALSGADFTITRANLQSGGQELNPIVRVFGRSTPALALNFAGETAAVVGLSYLFHRAGHHKLERAVSLVNLSGSAGAVAYDLERR